MPSKSIAKLDAFYRPLVAGVHEVAAEVGARLHERFETFLEAGEPAPDWALIQRLAGRLLAASNQRLLDLVHPGDQGSVEGIELGNRLEGMMARLLLLELFCH